MTDASKRDCAGDHLNASPMLVALRLTGALLNAHKPVGSLDASEPIQGQRAISAASLLAISVWQTSCPISP